MNISSIPGEYYLEGMREMASGFLFRHDGSFQFFFTYGAMDRYGSGKWESQNGNVVLNSGPAPAADFSLLESGSGETGFITIRVESPNPALLTYIYVSLEKGAEGSWHPLNQQGELRLPVQSLSDISLILEFCAERFSTIPIETAGHNRFIFRIEPSIMEVFFRDFSLGVQSEALIGNHPLMEGQDFRYVRQ